MWRIKYYLTTGQLRSKTFPSLEAATKFIVYSICSWDVYDCYKIDQPKDWACSRLSS